MIVRLVPRDPPVVQVFAALLAAVAPTPDLLQELN
jgi:hypothetical protein